MILPTASKGRWLALVLALLTLALIAVAIAWPAYVLHQRYDKVIAGAEEKIERYQKLASHRSEHQRALEVVKARESSRFYLKNVIPTAAGAELTDLVRPMIESNGSRLTSIQPATVKEDAGFRVYSLNIGFNGTPANVQKTLFAIETALPYIFIESLTLRATVPRGFKPQPNQEPEVSAQLEVQAYGAKAAPRSATAAGGNGAGAVKS
jgi:general secretion pathway protein M